MKTANTFKIFAVFFCSIVLALTIHAQEKPQAEFIGTYEAKDGIASFEAMIEQLIYRLMQEPETARGLIDISDKSDLAKKVEEILVRHPKLRNKINFTSSDKVIRPISYANFWIISLNAEPVDLGCRIPVCECPTLKVEGVEFFDSRAGYPIFTAVTLGGDEDALITYEWQISGGKIIEGQGTPTIKVDPISAKEITATVEIGDVCGECARTTSFTTKINGKLEIIDAFGYETSGQIRGRLDALLTRLNDNPVAKGYIINYGSRADKGFLKARRTQISEKFALRPQDLTNRTAVVDGGYREEAVTELWFSPNDFQKPFPTPTVDEKFVGVPTTKKSARRKSR